VIGNTGFIGGRLERRLKAAGARVTGLSRSRGFDILKDDLPIEGVDHVYHVAGLTYVPDAWLDPVSFYQVNAYGTVRVLEQCRRARATLTYLSTYVYGTPAQLPISETMPARPSNPYAFSKLAGEEACRFFAKAFGVDTRILRLFNVYGPGQRDAFLIPTIARQVLDPRVTEICVASLGPRRDYVYVDDVVEALVLASQLPPGSTFNVGSGKSISVRNVIQTCLACAGISKPFRERGEHRASEIPDMTADISAIRTACGWFPRTDFSTGIRSVLESMR
jgi:nucleoside-diphosphate-sugar epimerase